MREESVEEMNYPSFRRKVDPFAVTGGINTVVPINGIGDGFHQLVWDLSGSV